MIDNQQSYELPKFQKYSIENECEDYRTILYLCLKEDKNELCVGNTSHLTTHKQYFVISDLHDKIISITNTELLLSFFVTQILHCGLVIHTSC